MTAPPRAPRARVRVLDPERVAARRRSLRLSVAALAAPLGTSSGVLLRLEHGDSQEHLDLAFVADLARALGCPAADLMAHADFVVHGGEPAPIESLPDVPTDAQILGSVLFAAAGWIGVDDCCAHLSWPMDRVTDALRAFEHCAQGIGLRVAWNGDDVRLLPAHQDPGTPQPRAARGRRGVDAELAALLHRLARGDGETMVRRHSQIAQARLVALGLARAEATACDTGLALTDLARFNLCLSDEAPAEPSYGKRVD